MSLGLCSRVPSTCFVLLVTLLSLFNLENPGGAGPSVKSTDSTRGPFLSPVPLDLLGFRIAYPSVLSLGLCSVRGRDAQLISEFPSQALAGTERAVTRCWGLTVIGNVGHLKPFATVGFVGFELDPEFAGAGGKGDGPLVGLARLIGGD